MARVYVTIEGRYGSERVDASNDLLAGLSDAAAGAALGTSIPALGTAIGFIGGVVVGIGRALFERSPKARVILQKTVTAALQQGMPGHVTVGIDPAINGGSSEPDGCVIEGQVNRDAINKIVGDLRLNLQSVAQQYGGAGRKLTAAINTIRQDRTKQPNRSTLFIYDEYVPVQPPVRQRVSGVQPDEPMRLQRGLLWTAGAIALGWFVNR